MHDAWRVFDLVETVLQLTSWLLPTGFESAPDPWRPPTAPNASFVQRKRLRASRARPLESVAEGDVVKIVGRARAVSPRHVVSAPASGVSCLLHRTDVEYAVRGDEWTRDHHAAHAAPVMDLEVADGRTVRVAIADATVLFKLRYQRRGSATEPLPCPPALRDALPDTLEGVRTLREGGVAVGELVGVLGTVQWRADDDAPDTGFRSRGRRLWLASAPGRPLVLGDDPASLR